MSFKITFFQGKRSVNVSGGSYDYVYNRINDAAYCAKDKEIKELLFDLANLLHDEEWYESGDYGKDSYEETLKAFKKKWFKSDRSHRLKGYVDESLEKTREELYALIGV
jgi:hypothetical protein